MKVDDLINLLDLNNNRKEISHLLNAISDWPTDVASVEEYFLSVKEKTNISEINVSEIKHKLNQMDLLKNVWELESLNELILFLENYKSNDLGLPI